MGLKQDIVVVNEYTVKSATGGSRGGTPGAYVTRYMARTNATETLAPITRHRTDDFILRYMARESAVERAGSVASAKNEMRAAQGHGGVAFGYGSVSLSDEQLRAASKDIQHYFDAGHTVFKTVLSFDENYLKRHGLVGADFSCQQRGDYRGHLDQMKLRMAVMHGLDRMSKGHSGFDDLRFVAVIQIDTEHVHCHLAMVDAGVGHVMPDGTQRGKLSDRHKSRLRRGIDAWLDEKQAVRQLSSAVGYERRNVTAYVKRWAHQHMQSESLSQFLLACLPADRSLWRAGSHHVAMRKPNQLVRELVMEQLSRSGSPLPAAMEQVRQYADQRRAAEDLSRAAWLRMIEQGREQIVERCVNGVYGLLRSLPDDELRIRTPMLDVMGMDYQQLAGRARGEPGHADTGDDLVSFGFRLRSYSSRLKHHRDRHEAYRNLSRDWETADRAGVAARDSRALYDFYRGERDYHAQLMAKYQHFLPFSADPSAWYDRQQVVAEYGGRLLALIALRQDASLQRMKDERAAEALGRQIYDQPGGRLLTMGSAGRAVLDERIAAMRSTYDEKLDDLSRDLAGSGLVLVAGPSAQLGDAGLLDLRIEPGVAYDFDQVKGLDLHHLGYDFLRDVPVGPAVCQTFAAAAGQRRQLLLDAVEYLEHSGQPEAIVDLPTEDIMAMWRLSDELRRRGDGMLPSKLEQLRRDQENATVVRRSKAPSLDGDLSVRLARRVDQSALLSQPVPVEGRDGLG